MMNEKEMIISKINLKSFGVKIIIRIILLSLLVQVISNNKLNSSGRIILMLIQNLEAIRDQRFSSQRKWAGHGGLRGSKKERRKAIAH